MLTLHQFNRAYHKQHDPTHKPATVLVWQSDNGLWTIQRHDTTDKHGITHPGPYTLTDGRPGCSMYEIDAQFLAHVRQCLNLYKTHQVATPGYVCRAILRHVPEGA